MSNLVHRRRRCARILTHTILCLEGSTPEDMAVYFCLSSWGYLGFCLLLTVTGSPFRFRLFPDFITFVRH